MPEINTPDKTISISINGEDREFKMYYGLLNELMTTVRDLNDISLFFVNQEIRNEALVAILSVRDKNGKKIETIDPEGIDVDFEDLEKLLVWATSHVTAFFIRNLVQLTQQIQKIPRAPEETPSTSTPTGSQP